MATKKVVKEAAKVVERTADTFAEGYLTKCDEVREKLCEIANGMDKHNGMMSAQGIRGLARSLGSRS